MNKYTVRVYRFFCGYEDFIVEAVDKAEAIEIVRTKVKRTGGGNYKIEDIKVIKKHQKGK